ncbi:MAG: sugar phosphate isomerase/epimerase family protein [Promethearchaeia archaeon]
MNRLSVTSAPLPALVGRTYYDVDATLRVMQKLCDESVVNGFEFQWLAEWEKKFPPKVESSPGIRREPWKESSSYDVDSLAKILTDSGVPILSVHANRDVGIYLCGNDAEIQYGREMIHDTLELAERIGANIAVFHAWDTYSKSFNIDQLEAILSEEGSHFPGIVASVENVPTHLPDLTPVALVEQFEWITLDTRWAAMYDELSKFERLMDRIANIHVRGYLQGGRWELPEAPFSFQDAIELVVRRWGYDGRLTLEPEGGIDEESWPNFLQALNWLKSVSHNTLV